MYIHQEFSGIAQNINNVQWGLMPAGRGQQPLPRGQKYHLSGNTLIGAYSARHMDHRKIGDHRLTLDISSHATGYPLVNMLPGRTL